MSVIRLSLRLKQVLRGLPQHLDGILFKAVSLHNITKVFDGLQAVVGRTAFADFLQYNEDQLQSVLVKNLIHDIYHTSQKKYRVMTISDKERMPCTCQDFPPKKFHFYQVQISAITDFTQAPHLTDGRLRFLIFVQQHYVGITYLK